MHLIRCMCLINRFQVRGNANNTNIVSFVLTGYGFMLATMHVLCACTFSITRALNARLRKVRPERCMVLTESPRKSHIQGSDFVFS